MISKQAAKKYLHRLGILLGIAGVLFVGQRLLAYRSEIDIGAIGAAGYVYIGLLSLLYGAANVLLAVGWHEILRHLGIERPMRWTLRTYAISQLAKYVPGNIFHLVGRQALGAAAGIGNGPLAKSSVLELVIIALCAGLFLPLLLPLVLAAVSPGESLVLFGMTAALSIAIADRYLGRRLARAATLYASHLATAGAIFVAAYFVAGGDALARELPAIAGAYVLAWLAGLVTPGAPAGLGVRETVLLFLLAGLGAEATILLAVVLGRVITVLGDMLFYVAGQFVRPSATVESSP